MGKGRGRKSRFVDYYYVLNSERGPILQILELRLRYSLSYKGHITQELKPNFYVFFLFCQTTTMFKCLYSAQNPVFPFVNQLTVNEKLLANDKC